jgi:hypothetical protein
MTEIEKPFFPEPNIIGDLSPEEREKALEEARRLVRDGAYEKFPEEIRERLPQLEYDKRPEEIALLNYANTVTNALRERAGLPIYTVPPERYVLLPDAVYRRVGGYGDATSYGEQITIVNAESVRRSKLVFGAIALHEMVHLKGAQTFQAVEGGTKLMPRRGGFVALGTHGDVALRRGHQHFYGLEEAVTEEIVKKVFPDMAKLPEVQEEVAWMATKEAQEIHKRIAEETNIPEEEIYWVSHNGKDFEYFGYLAVRKTLRYVVETIAKDTASTPDDVFDAFSRARLTGNLVPVARLVARSFGKHGMRILGMMDTDPSIAVNAYEFLHAVRADRKRE